MLVLPPLSRGNSIFHTFSQNDLFNLHVRFSQKPKVEKKTVNKIFYFDLLRFLTARLHLGHNPNPRFLSPTKSWFVNF